MKHSMVYMANNKKIKLITINVDYYANYFTRTGKRENISSLMSQKLHLKYTHV